MTHTSILVPVSLTGGRDHAFDTGVALATATRAELHLLHAVAADLPYSFRAGERLRRLLELRQRAQAAGLTVHVEERHGDPAAVIARYANAQAVDLVVLAAEPRRGWAGWLHSSLAERLLKHVQRPTLLVPAAPGPLPDYATAVVAVDDVASLSPLVTRAAALIGAERLSVVHVIDNLESAGAVQSPARWLVPEFREHVVRETARALSEALPAHLDVPVRVTTGPVLDAIETAVTDADAGLLVIGASRRFRHLGSTAARLLRRAPCALLVLPHAPAMTSARDIAA